MKILNLSAVLLVIAGCGSPKSTDDGSSSKQTLPGYDEIIALEYKSGGGFAGPGVASHTVLSLQKTDYGVYVELAVGGDRHFYGIPAAEMDNLLRLVSIARIRVGQQMMADAGEHTLTIRFRFSPNRVFHMRDDDTSYNEYILNDGGAVENALQALIQVLRDGHYPTPMPYTVSN